MAHAFYHAKSSAKAFGGKWEDYIELHNQMDQTKSSWPEASHRAIFHSAYGCFIMEKIFGLTIKNSDGKDIPVRALAEKHILEDHGFIPTLEDWLSKIPLEPWMYKKAKRLSKNKTLE